MPTRLAAALFGAWMAVLGVVFWLAPAWQTPVRLVAGASAVLSRSGSASGGTGRRGPLPWRLLAVTVALSASGTALFSAPAVVRQPVLAAGRRTGCCSPSTRCSRWCCCCSCGTAPAAPGTGAACSTPSPSPPASTLLAWAYAIAPHLREMDVTAAEQWIALAFPVGDLLCLAMLIRLLTTSSRRLAAAGLLGAGILAMLIADVGYNLVDAARRPGRSWPPSAGSRCTPRPAWPPCTRR